MNDVVVTLGSDGLRRAAVLLMVLDEAATAEVLKQFEPDEVQRIARAMGHLRNVEREEISETLKDFLRTVREQSLLGESALGGARIRNILVDVLGSDQASEIISRIAVLDRRAGGLQSLSRKESTELAAIAKAQHPQIAAALLSQLDDVKAGEVLKLLPEDMMQDMVVRVARLDSVSQTAIEELKRLVSVHFDEESDVPDFKVGGTQMAATLLNGMGKDDREKVFEQIRTTDEPLAEEIEDLMFSFDDLLKVDDRGLQLVLAEVSSQVLVLALKGAEDHTKEKIFKNMSKRAAELLKDDLEIGGPVKLSEVEGAQKEVIMGVRRMMEEGAVIVDGMGGGETFVS